MDESKKNLEKLRELSHKLEETEEQLSAFFNLSPVLFCIAHKSGFFNKVNPAWEKMMGMSSNDITSCPWIEFVHPDDRSETIKLSEKMKTGEVRDFVNRYKTKSGKYRHIRWVASVFYGEVAFCVAQDVTDEVKNERR